MKNCEICQEKLRGKQRRFCSKKCKAVLEENRVNSIRSHNDRSKNRKVQLVNISGGKCKICGYNKNYASLCFHHRDPKQKLFRLDARHVASKNWNIILEELDKCDLLCHNCHLELHNPGFDFELLKEKGYEQSYSGKVVKKKFFKIPLPNKDELQKKLWEKSMENIAKDYAVTGATIGKWVAELGLEKPSHCYWNSIASGQKKTKIPPKEELLELKKTMSTKEICAKLGAAKTTVNRWLREYNSKK